VSSSSPRWGDDKTPAFWQARLPGPATDGRGVSLTPGGKALQHGVPILTDRSTEPADLGGPRAGLLHAAVWDAHIVAPFVCPLWTLWVRAWVRSVVQSGVVSRFWPPVVHSCPRSHTRSQTRGSLIIRQVVGSTPTCPTFAQVSGLHLVVG
jgi:hypothetical protein